LDGEQTGRLWRTGRSGGKLSRDVEESVKSEGTALRI
jgi:hypothetical protein